MFDVQSHDHRQQIVDSLSGRFGVRPGGAVSRRNVQIPVRPDDRFTTVMATGQPLDDDLFRVGGALSGCLQAGRKAGHATFLISALLGISRAEDKDLPVLFVSGMERKRVELPFRVEKQLARVGAGVGRIESVDFSRQLGHDEAVATRFLGDKNRLLEFQFGKGRHSLKWSWRFWGSHDG